MRTLDLIGYTVGFLTVVEFVGTERKHGRSCRMWRCACSCGGALVMETSRIRAGGTKSCGCSTRELKSSHGMTHSPEYRAWAAMKQRCENHRSSRFHDYGGRGISICDRWQNFDSFFHDMGPRPSPDHSIDRIDNNGNYEPDNCRWATRSEQQNNRRRHTDPSKLPRGDRHWTRRNPEKIRSLAKRNARKRTYLRGELNPNSKLNNETARRLREYKAANPTVPFAEVGRLFGVGRETARKVVKEVAWKL